MAKLIISNFIYLFVSCLIFSSIAAANEYGKSKHMNKCDVVAINGTGKLLEDGRIAGMETVTVIGTTKQFDIKFTAVQLAAINVDQNTAAVTVAASHDFTSMKNHRVNFTSFDEITIIPLGGYDATCTQNACGLIFRLRVVTGHGPYNCGEIVSGYNPDPSASIPFTSFVNPATPTPTGDTVFLNSMGKLCLCE